MKEKKLELKRLNRAELIEIIYELQKQNEENTARIAQMQEMLSDRELRISSAGSIAEAALSINGVLEAAQAAADQYLLSIKAATADMANRGSPCCWPLSSKRHKQSDLPRKRHRGFWRMPSVKPQKNGRSLKNALTS